MKAIVYVDTKQVGTAELHADEALPGCIRGVLLPNEKYHALENGAINVQLENGYFALMNDQCRISINGDSRPPEITLNGMNHDVVNYVQRRDTEKFIGAPWGCISIDQKIVFEEELKREIANRKRS